MNNLIKQNILLAHYTSWQVGGMAEYFALPEDIEDLKKIQKRTQENHQSIIILGGGSNVLISDRGIKGITICLRNFNQVQVEEKDERLIVEADAGFAKAELLKIFLKYKLAPALFLAGLPGEIGGGVVMNAGVAEMFTPREFVEITDWVDVLMPTGNIIRKNKAELQWSYRHCKGWEPGIVVKVGMSWEMKPDETILSKVKEANRIRLSKQPLDKPSCGSVFMNSPGKKAAQLIDSCGLKGFQIGDAQVSLKHANFVVNLGKAKASDIWSVIQHVQKIVLEKTGIELKTEVIRLGLWD